MKISWVFLEKGMDIIGWTSKQGGGGKGKGKERGMGKEKAVVFNQIKQSSDLFYSGKLARQCALATQPAVYGLRVHSRNPTTLLSPSHPQVPGVYIKIMPRFGEKGKE